MRAICTASRALLVSWFLAAPALLGAEPATLAPIREEGFSKHWWERLRPARETATEQLQYADELRENGDLKQASREYRALVFNWPKSPEAPVAQFNYADCLDRRELPEDAFRAYQFLVDVYSGFFSYDEVVARQVAAAGKIADRKRMFLFFKYSAPEEAIPFFEEIIKNCPRCNGVPELQCRVGKIHEKAGHYEQAAEAYHKYVRLFPDGPLAAQAGFGYAGCCYRVSQKSPNDKDLRAIARAALEYFLGSFPESGSALQAKAWLEELRMIQASACYNEALAYEKSAARTRDAKQRAALLTAAKTVYERLIREHPGSRWAPVAQARLAHVAQELEKYNEK